MTILPNSELGSERARGSPRSRDRQFVQLILLALVLIAVGVVIGRIFRSVAKHSYRPEPFEVNFNLA
jgi:hypothetical protein